MNPGTNGAIPAKLIRNIRPTVMAGLAEAGGGGEKKYAAPM